MSWTIIVTSGERNDFDGAYGTFNSCDEADAFLEKHFGAYEPDSFYGPWFDVVKVDETDRLLEVFKDLAA